MPRSATCSTISSRKPGDLRMETRRRHEFASSNGLGAHPRASYTWNATVGPLACSSCGRTPWPGTRASAGGTPLSCSAPSPPRQKGRETQRVGPWQGADGANRDPHGLPEGSPPGLRGCRGRYSSVAAIALWRLAGAPGKAPDGPQAAGPGRQR